jgi:hypothetical protein
MALKKQKGAAGEKDKSKLILITFSTFFIVLLFSVIVVSNLSDVSDVTGHDNIIDMVRENEARGGFGEVWFHLGNLPQIDYNLTLDDGGYIYVWEPVKDLQAPGKGWLITENPFYQIRINLDKSYYMLYDKGSEREILIYNDEVEDPVNVLTGSDMGFADHDGDNPDSFASTATHDKNGIGRYLIRWVDEEGGFLLLGLEGWDYFPDDYSQGFDVEGEVLLGIFSDKPYFFDTTEITNLKDTFSTPIPYKNPDEIGKSWVITSDFDSAVIKGGDLDHLNADLWTPWYVVKDINGEGRKPWHFGSAQFSKMFPDHRLIGNKENGGIIFSLPKGRFRFDDSLGPYGDQVVGEFLLVVNEPVRAISFTSEPVNEYDYFYDPESFSSDYMVSMVQICDKYGLICPKEPLDVHNWTSKRFGYVISLVDDWYDPASNQPYSAVWSGADESLSDFQRYEDVIYEQMESTEPLISMGF